MTGYVYAIRCGDAVKIGFTIDIEQRATVLRTGSPFAHKLVGLIPATREQERECHKLLAPWRIRGEWFDVNARPVAAFVSMMPMVQPAPYDGPRRPRPALSPVSMWLQERGLTVSGIARHLKVNKASISKWKRIPAVHVIEVERATGIPRQEIRPDIYPPQDPFPGAAA